MKKVNQFFRNNLFVLVLTSIGFGFLFGEYMPQFSASLKVLIVPILFLMIFVMIIPMEFKEMLNIKKYKKEIIWGSLSILILAPFIAYLISFAFPEKYSFLKIGLILAATMPPGGMIVSWTGLLNAKIELAMILQTLTFILAILTIPLTLFLFLPLSVHFSQGLLIQNLILYIFLPLIVGFVTQILLKKKYAKETIKLWKPSLSTISSICALLVIFISTSLKAQSIIEEPQLLFWGILLAFIYYFILFLISLFFTGFLVKSYDNQMPIVYGTTAKNLSIGMALALTVFSGPIVLGVVFCFIVQMPMLSLFYKFIRKEEQEFSSEVEEGKIHPISMALRKIRKAGSKKF